MHSVAGTMSRVTTVTSLLKRFLSKDDNKPESRPPSGGNNAEAGMRLGTSASSASITGKHPTQTGSTKLADQVIEELDEQMTITSLRNKDNSRPTAQSIFSNVPIPSDPVDVPGRVPPPYTRFHSAQVHGMEENSALFPPGGVDDLLSSSAPAGNVPLASSSKLPETLTTSNPKQSGSQESKRSATAEELDSMQAIREHDEFEKLRQEREAARIARQMEKMARGISTHQGLVNQIELQELLTDALTKPQTGSGTTTPT